MQLSVLPGPPIEISHEPRCGRVSRQHGAFLRRQEAWAIDPPPRNHRDRLHSCATCYQGTTTGFRSIYTVGTGDRPFSSRIIYSVFHEVEAHSERVFSSRASDV